MLNMVFYRLGEYGYVIHKILCILTMLVDDGFYKPLELCRNILESPCKHVLGAIPGESKLLLVLFLDLDLVIPCL